jgi:hypothetical protein
MNRIARWIWPLPMLAASLALRGQPDADAKLQSLYDAHHWFALRATVDDRSPVFFPGAVAVAFHDLENARRHLKDAIAAAPASDQAREAQNLLVSLAFRSGAHRAAHARLAAMLRQRPDDAGTANALPLAAALAAAPDQAVSHRASVRIEPRETRGGYFLPIAINGKAAHYVLDTGANFSVLTESEARRCGLTVHDAATKIANVGGAAIGLRAAVAEEVAIGSVRMTQVAFLVFRDDQQPFNAMAPTERGAIGLPVLLALQTLRVHRDGAIELGFPPAKATASAAPPNLAFDNLYPIARAECTGQPLTLVVKPAHARRSSGRRLHARSPRSWRRRKRSPASAPPKQFARRPCRKSCCASAISRRRSSPRASTSRNPALRATISPATSAAISSAKRRAFPSIFPRCG